MLHPLHGKGCHVKVENRYLHSFCTKASYLTNRLRCYLSCHGNGNEEEESVFG
jgi:hypothetical protein